MGSGIVLVLGSGLGQDEFNVPDLYSLSYQEALMMLQTTGLNVGAVIPDPDVKDTSNAYVYRQSPERFTYDRRYNRIRPGQTIDLWLSSQKPARAVDSSQLNL
jgi:beta-lactam-binding protein with PASTA domain